MRNTRTKKLVTTSLLAALMLVLQLTGIGILPIPPAGVTVLHIPIIIGTLACGIYAGLFLSLEFGVLSMIMAYRVPSPLSVCFMNPLVAVIPRLLIPVSVFLIAKALAGRKTMRAALCAAAGSLTNTVFVLFAVCALYGELFAQTLGVSRNGLLGGVLTLGALSGLPEAAVAVIITLAVDKALNAMGFYKGVS